MLTSPNLSLPYIDVNAAQREIVHNEAIRDLDALVQLAVLDRDLATPPGSPSEGQRWIVAASPSGAWSGHANEIAAWQDAAWRFHVPRIGWLVYVVDEGALLAWNGSAWVDALSMLTTIQNVSQFGVCTTADATNPFSAKLNNALWVAKTVAEGGDGHLRYKLSKESTAHTLSVLMQTNYAGRAEMGLTGDDDFHVKVSPDGTTWYDSLVIAKSSGKVAVGAIAATQQLDVNADTAAVAVFDTRSYAANRGGSILFQGFDSHSSPERTTWAALYGLGTSGTQGAEAGDMVGYTMRAGTLTEAWRAKNTGEFQAGSFSATLVGISAPSAGMYLPTAHTLTLTSQGFGMFAMNRSSNLGVSSSMSFLFDLTAGATDRNGIQLRGPYTEGAFTGMLFTKSDDTTCGSIGVNQTAGTVAFNTTSDETLKMMFDEDDIDWGERIDALWVGAYQMRSDPGQWRLGIRAQQAHGIVPQGVTRPVRDGDLWQADYGLALGPLAMWGVKDLRGRVSSLEAKVAGLDARLTALEASS